MKDTCITLLAQYMLHKKLCAGTIVDRATGSNGNITIEEYHDARTFYKSIVRTAHFNCNSYQLSHFNLV